MFNNVTIKQYNDGRWFKAMATMTTWKTLLMLIAFTLVLRARAKAATLAESEINKFQTKETFKLTKNPAAAAVKQNQPELRQFYFNGFMMPPAPAPGPPLPSSASPPGCPLCDSSVYSYCSHKLIHDSCCCDFPGVAIYQKPPQCAFFDCTLLYAKSCYEHSLIKNCCCNNP